MSVEKANCLGWVGGWFVGRWVGGLGGWVGGVPGCMGCCGTSLH